MQYNFDLKRMKKTPLQELVEMRNSRIDADTKQKADAQTFLNKNTESEVYTKKDKDGVVRYYEKVMDDAGGLDEQEITQSSYNQKDARNKFIDKQRVMIGGKSTYGAPDDRTKPPKPGYLSRGVDALKGMYGKASDYFGGDSGDSTTAKPEDVYQDKDGLDYSKVPKIISAHDDHTKKKTTPVDLNKDKLNQANQSANTNIGGVNIDITKGVNGGGVKASLMDDKIGKTMPIPSQSTTDAYAKSLGDRENRAKAKASLIGKPPPNPARDRTLKPTSEAELTKIGQGIDKRNKLADERSKDFSARKIGTGSVTPQQLRKQGGFMKGGYKKSYERATQVEGRVKFHSPEQRQSVLNTSGRLKLPSMSNQTNQASDKIQAYTDSLQAKRKQKELSKPKYSQSLPQQPDMADDVAMGKIKQQGTYLPDTGGALKVIYPTAGMPAKQKGSGEYKAKGSVGGKASGTTIYKGRVRKPGYVTPTGKRRVKQLKSVLKKTGDFIAKPETNRKVVGGLTPTPQKKKRKQLQWAGDKDVSEALKFRK